MATAFKVQGELTLAGGAQFVSDLKSVKSAVAEVTLETGRLGTTAGSTSRSTAELAQSSKQLAGQHAQVQTTAAASAKAQAEGFAKLAAETAKAGQQAKEVQTSVAEWAQCSSRAISDTMANLNKAPGSGNAGIDAWAKRSGQTLRESYSGAGKAAMGLKAANDDAAVSTGRLKAANDDFARSVHGVAGSLNIYQKTQLGYQLNDVFVQMASGQGVLRTFVQQGPQITQIFGGIGNTLRAVPWAATGYAAAIGLVLAATVGAASRLNSMATESRQLEVSLQATGRTANITAAQLQEVIRLEANRAGAGAGDTRVAAQQLLSNSAITGHNIQATLSLARDLARVTGMELPQAAAVLSEGLDGTAAGAVKLDAAFHALTPRELEQVRRFGELGDKGAVVSIMLSALERNLGGANERGLTPFEAGTAKLRSSWHSLLESLGKTGVIQGLATLINNVAAPLHLAAWSAERLRSALPGNDGGPTNDDIERARRSVSVERLTLEQLQRDQRTAHQDDRHAFELSILASQRRLREGEANLAQLEARASSLAGKTVRDQVEAGATAVTNELKTVDEIVARASTIAGQRRALEAERNRIEAAIRSGGSLLDPDQVARWQERIVQINGALSGLRTPVDELRRSLDQETELSKLPQHLRSAQQAYIDTKRRAIELGQADAEATQLAEQARTNALRSHATGVQQQIQILSAEAQAALRVADAYGVSRAAALRLQAVLKAGVAVQQGQIAPGDVATFAQQSLEQDAAAAIAAAAEKNAAYGREVAALDRLVEAEGRSSAAARETERANRVATYAEDLRAQAAATNNATIIAAAERQVAAYDALTRKAVQFDLRRDARALNRQHDPATAYDHEISKLRELETTGLLTARTVEDAMRDAERRKLEASRDTIDGMIAGLRRYADEAGNAGQAAGEGMRTGMRTAEDAILGATGLIQANWGNMVNQMLADIARLTIRQNITAPIAKAVGSIDFGGIFGRGGSFGPEFELHTGGLAGQARQTDRDLPPWIWSRAPRFHAGRTPGLAVNEIPAILTDDEEVLTSTHPRHRWNQGRALNDNTAAPNVSVNVTVNSSKPVRVSEGPMTPDGRGGWNKDVIIDEIDAALADRALDGRGKHYGAMQTVFGVKRVGRR